MAQENVVKFREALESNEALRTELTELYRRSDTDEDFDLPGSVVALGAKYGFAFSHEEMQAARTEWEAEMTDEELEKIAGGPFVYYEGEDQSRRRRRRGW